MMSMAAYLLYIPAAPEEFDVTSLGVSRRGLTERENMARLILKGAGGYFHELATPTPWVSLVLAALA